MSAITSALAQGFEKTKPATLHKTPLRMRHPDFTKDPIESASSGEDSDYSEGETTCVDETVEENYVRKVLAKEKPLPPITLSNWYKEINVVSTLALTIVPLLAFYGALTTPLQTKTFLWSIAYYYFTGLGEFSFLLATPSHATLFPSFLHLEKPQIFPNLLYYQFSQSRHLPL